MDDLPEIKPETHRPARLAAAVFAISLALHGVAVAAATAWMVWGLDSDVLLSLLDGDGFVQQGSSGQAGRGERTTTTMAIRYEVPEVIAPPSLAQPAAAPLEEETAETPAPDPADEATAEATPAEIALETPPDDAAPEVIDAADDPPVDLTLESTVDLAPTKVAATPPKPRMADDAPPVAPEVRVAATVVATIPEPRQAAARRRQSTTSKPSPDAKPIAKATSAAARSQVVTAWRSEKAASDQPPAPQVGTKGLAAPRLGQTAGKVNGDGSILAGMPYRGTSNIGGRGDQLPGLPPNRLPPYPIEALRARVEGRVLVRTMVDARGNVEWVKLHKSSGSGSLDEAALKAVRTWRFGPAKRRGVAIDFEVIVPVNFTIADAFRS